MKLFYITFLLLFSVASNSQAQVENAEGALKQQHESAGKIDAQNFMIEYLQLDKSKYQRAYKVYKRDLEEIFITAEPPDNQELYQDLIQMESNEPIIYKKTIRRGDLYKKYQH